MREIKFRAWDRKHGMMTKPFTLWNVCEARFTPKEFADFQFRQYTGLKDKNGKEIYEGDVVEWGSDKYRMPVEWDNENSHYNPAFNSTTEIVGNIYENPDLLSTPK